MTYATGALRWLALACPEVMIAVETMVSLPKVHSADPVSLGTLLPGRPITSSLTLL
jgi:hypothetical protein